MAKRSKMSKKGSKALFSKTGAAVQSINNHYSPMRGGYRI